VRGQRGPPPPKIRVLELGCGKGGDLIKWQKAHVDEYVGVDIAETSVAQARQRWEGLKGNRFHASFFVLDAFGVRRRRCVSLIS